MLRHCKQALKEERREQRRLMNLGGGRRGQSASVAVASEIRPISEVTGKRKRGRPSLKEAAAKSRRLPLTNTTTPTLSTISNNNRNDSNSTSAASSSKYEYKEESTGEENEDTDTEEERSLEITNFDYVEDIEEEGFKEEEEAKPDELLSPTTGSDQSNNKNSNHSIQAILSKAIPSTSSSSSSTSSAVPSKITPAPPRPIVFAVKSTAAAQSQRTRTQQTQTLLSLLNTVSTGTQTSPSKRRRSSSEVSAGEEEGERSPMGSPSSPPPSPPSTPSSLNSKPLMTRTLAYSEKFKRCSECSFRFRADLLRAHYHEAHGDLRVRCAALPTCTVRFATEAAMLAHSAAIHIACTGCRTVFLNRSELQYHKSMGCYQKGSPNGKPFLNYGVMISSHFPTFSSSANAFCTCCSSSKLVRGHQVYPGFKDFEQQQQQQQQWQHLLINININFITN